jgi:hypothetical protein
MVSFIVGALWHAVFFTLTGRWVYGYWYWKDGK